MPAALDRRPHLLPFLRRLSATMTAIASTVYRRFRLALLSVLFAAPPAADPADSGTGADDSDDSAPAAEGMEVDNVNNNNVVDVNPAGNPTALSTPTPTSDSGPDLVFLTREELDQAVSRAAAAAAVQAVAAERERVNTSRHPSAKAKKPDRWDHLRVPARDFLLQLQNYFVADRVPEADRVSQAITFLQAELQLWLANYCLIHDLQQASLTWEEFSTALITGRGVQHPQETVRDRLTRLRLTPGTAGEYHQAVRAILSDIADTAIYGVSPAELVGFVLRSLERHYPALAPLARLTPEGRPWTDPEALMLLITRHDAKSKGKQTSAPGPASDSRGAKPGSGPSGSGVPPGGRRPDQPRRRPRSSSPAKTAKKRGYVTLEELNEALPSDQVDPDKIDDIMAMFSECGTPRTLFT